MVQYRWLGCLARCILRGFLATILWPTAVSAVVPTTIAPEQRHDHWLLQHQQRQHGRSGEQYTPLRAKPSSSSPNTGAASTAENCMAKNIVSTCFGGSKWDDIPREMRGLSSTKRYRSGKSSLRAAVLYSVPHHRASSAAFLVGAGATTATSSRARNHDSNTVQMLARSSYLSVQQRVFSLFSIGPSRLCCGPFLKDHAVKSGCHEGYHHGGAWRQSGGSLQLSVESSNPPRMKNFGLQLAHRVNVRGCIAERDRGESLKEIYGGVAPSCGVDGGFLRRHIALHARQDISGDDVKNHDPDHPSSRYAVARASYALAECFIGCNIEIARGRKHVAVCLHRASTRIVFPLSKTPRNQKPVTPHPIHHSPNMKHSHQITTIVVRLLLCSCCTTSNVLWYITFEMGTA